MFWGGMKMILGILVNSDVLHRFDNGKITAGIDSLAEEAILQNVEVVVFSPAHIDWWDKKVNGFIFSCNDKKWKRGICDFPDVIYDRAIFSKYEKEMGKLVRKLLKEQYNIPYVNGKNYFNKWNTHKLLLSCNSLKQYLPDTALCTNILSLDRFLDMYKDVYIKDSGGKRGKNIFKVHKESKGVYAVSYRDGRENHYKRLSLEQVFNNVINVKLKDKVVIMQQGIDLAHIDERTFDLRLHAMKNGLGKWEIIDKSVRVGAQGSPVTNISSGGEIKKFHEVIPLVFPDLVNSISEKVDSMALDICRFLEQKYGSLGELGIDAALDVYGRLWFIEVNGKPAKKCIYGSNDNKLIRYANKNLVQYCCYIVDMKNEAILR